MAEKKTASKDKVENKKSVKSEGLVSHYIQLAENRYLVLRDFIALTFFVAALYVMAPLARESQATRVMLSIYGAVVILISLWLIITFVVKTVRLQADPKIKRYSALVSLNSFFGLSMPILFINLVLFKVVGGFLFFMPKTGSIFCQFRHWLYDFLYRDIHIYQKLDQLFMFTVLLAVAVFMIGGVWEKTNRK